MRPPLTKQEEQQIETRAYLLNVIYKLARDGKDDTLMHWVPRAAACGVSTHEIRDTIRDAREEAPPHG